MKIDVKNQTPYRSNEDEGTSGTKPAAPGPKPRTYPPANTPVQAGSERGGDTGATDHAKAPPSDTGDTVSAKEKPGEPAKPQTNEDGTADANPGVPAQSSASVPPPNGNTLQIKVAGIVNAVPPLKPSGSTPITGHTTKAGNVQRSNQAGYTAGNAGRSLTKGIGDAGELAQSGNQDERTRYALQLIKDLANGSASGIDLKRMTDKKTVAHEYLHGPRRKGAYNVEHGGHGTPHRQQIELKSMRTLPKAKATQTLAISQSVAGVQVQPNQSGKQTQAQTPTSTQSSQTSPNTYDAATQTMPAADASTQTSTPQAPAQGDGAPQTAGEHSSTGAPHSPREPASSPDHHKTTQTSSPDRANRGTTTPMPDSTDAGVQNGADMQDGSTQHAPPQHSVQTQTSVPVTSTRTTPAPQPPQLHVSEPTNGNETTTATQAGAPLDTHGTQTATGTPKATQLSPQRQTAGTQTSSPSVHHSATQHTPRQVHAHSQTTFGNTSSAETQTGADNSKGSQANTDTHTVGTQSKVGTGEAKTQANPGSENKSIQTRPPVQQHATQTPPTPDTGAAQSNPVGTPASQESVETTHTSEQVPGATSKSIELTKGVKENGHWVVADIGSLPADINNVKKHADLGSISAITSTSAVTAGDVLNVINSEGGRALALGAKSLSLLGTLVGLAPSVGQLANDVKQLIANPNDNQSKWNVANSGFELGGGLAAAAASMAFPPAALLPILFPNLAEIGHAEILRQKKNGLYAEGLKVEGDATSNDYKIAALNATPIVNWFSSTYTPELRPAIEKFETEQGNKPGNPPAGDLPENTLHDQRVYDYYAQALNERAALLGNAANSYLKSIADNSTLSSVTMVSRCPQVFGWPSNGQAMRVFDRAAAITYDRVHDTIHTEFFGPDKDGTYRLPTRDPSLPSGKDSKNLLFCSTMLDPEAKRVDFDLPQYFADPGTVALDIRKQPNKT